jgi:hypothetical protein
MASKAKSKSARIARIPKGMAKLLAAAKRPAALNGRQLAFARHYFEGPTRGSGSASARLAGYEGTDASLETTASRLLRHAGVERELGRLRRLVESKTIASAAERLLMLSEMGRGEIEVPLGIHDGVVIYGKPKASDRRGAAELVAKMNGELRETVDVNATHTGPNGGPIEHTVSVPPSVARAQLLAIYVEKFGPEEGERHVRKLLGEPEPVAIEAPKEAT